MDFKLNWLGLYASDFEAALHFYSDVLGMSTRVAKADFALFRTTGMALELFAGGLSWKSRRLWGDGQNVRASIQIADLKATISDLEDKGVQFSGDVEQKSFGAQIELFAPEDIRWTLAQTSAYPFSSGLQKPHLGWVEIKAHRFAEQQAFYREVFGMRPEMGEDEGVVFRHSAGEPLLFLKPGAEQTAPVQIEQGVPILWPPHMIGFETSNIQQAAAWLKQHGAPILVDAVQQDWGGIELISADADGNPIQLVQYLRR